MPLNMHNASKPKTLMGFTSEFVKTLNVAIPNFNLKDFEEVSEIQALQQRLNSIMGKLASSEENASVLLDQIENSSPTCKDVVYVRHDNNLKAIVSRDIIKPKIRALQKLQIDCTCDWQIKKQFQASKGFFIVETEEKLREVDSALNEAVVGVFSHSYRTYTPFCCIIALYSPDGYIYIIDAIKFRTIIPGLRLLKCGVKKVFTSRRAVDAIFTDFGTMGCYRNFDIPASDFYVDWRIRPINEAFEGIICDDLMKAVEKLNMGLPTELHVPTVEDATANFLGEFNLTEVSAEIVKNLLNFRDYLAKLNDEGPQYVISDKQLYNLIVNMPSSLEEFESLFDRMSAVLRLHASDFMIILNRKSKIFSLEQLKSKRLENEINEARLNDKRGHDEFKCRNIEESEESELEISEE